MEQGILEKIRSRGKLVAVVVMVAIAAFILEEYLRGESSRNSNREPLGIVGDKEIMPNEFGVKVEEFAAINAQPNMPQDYLKQQASQQVWNDYFRTDVLDKEFQKLGLSVPQEEINDMFVGSNIAKEVMEIPIFQDSITRAFDPSLLTKYVATINDPANKEKTKEEQKRWNGFTKSLVGNRSVNKYNTLLTKSLYTTTFEAKKSIAENQNTVNARIVSKSYAMIADSTIKVTDEEIKNAYDARKYMFNQDYDARKITYALLNIQPSGKDVNNAISKAANLKDGFQTIEDPEQLINFVNKNSDKGFKKTAYNKNEIKGLDSVMKTPNTVYGPFQENNVVYLVKYLDNKTFTDSVKASHILIKKESKSKEEAIAIFDSIKIKIAQGMPFELAAMQYSEDEGSKMKGGDLGFFGKGMMVKPFEEAAFKTKIGDLEVVTSDFGTHLLKVQNKKESVKPEVITIEQKITPSKETESTAYSLLAKLEPLKTKEEFEAVAKANGIALQNQPNIKKEQKSIGAIQDAGSIVTWAFESKIFDVKKFVLGSENIVAIITGVRTKGMPRMEEVKEESEMIAKQMKKGDMIAVEMSKAGASLEAVATTMNLKIDSANALNFNGFVPNVGQDPVLIAKMFNAKQGAVSKPVKGMSGVYMFIVDAVNNNTPITPENITEFKKSNTEKLSGSIPTKLTAVLSKKYNVVDNRFKYGY